MSIVSDRDSAQNFSAKIKKVQRKDKEQNNVLRSA